MSSASLSTFPARPIDIFWAQAPEDAVPYIQGISYSGDSETMRMRAHNSARRRGLKALTRIRVEVIDGKDREVLWVKFVANSGSDNRRHIKQELS
jgi:hypothetical protein